MLFWKFRDKTERPKALEAGTIKLTGTNKQAIINEVDPILTNNQYYISMAETANPY